MNASDKPQVERAGRKQKNRREQELADIRAMLELREGRRFIWSRLEKCKVFASIWDPSAKIHFLEGRRDVGLQLMADVAEADETAFLVMMTEEQQQKKQERQEREALNQQAKEGQDARSESD